MEKYRKPDHIYIDKYDRMTIGHLKAIEKNEKQEFDAAPPDMRPSILMWHTVKPTSFSNSGVSLARNKGESLRQAMQSDEEKDRLVSLHPVPKNVRCNTCSSRMIFATHYFKDNFNAGEKTSIFFVFDCPKGHKPRKTTYPDGEEFFWPTPKCTVCGHELTSTSEKEKDILTCTDLCTKCGKKEVYEYDVSFVPEEPILEEDRKKYCTDFIRRRTFHEDLEAIANLFKKHPEILEEKKEEAGLDKIEIITIPALEQRLTKKMEELGLIKFQFDKPLIDQHVIIPFSVQDPTSRKDHESSSLLTKTLKKELLPTNWRLTATGVSYRLGFLTGQLKAYEQDNDLRKIAREILNKTKDFAAKKKKKNQ